MEADRQQQQQRQDAFAAAGHSLVSNVHLAGLQSSVDQLCTALGVMPSVMPLVFADVSAVDVRKAGYSDDIGECAKILLQSKYGNDQLKKGFKDIDKMDAAAFVGTSAL